MGWFEGRKGKSLNFKLNFRFSCRSGFEPRPECLFRTLFAAKSRSYTAFQTEFE